MHLAKLSLLALRMTQALPCELATLGTEATLNSRTALASNGEAPIGGNTMKLKDLAGQVKAGTVQELNLVSVEGGSYTLHAVVDGASQRVLNDKDDTVHVASVDEARKLLMDVPDQVELFVVQPAVYDEMVGQDSGPTDSRERIPLKHSH